MTEGPPGQSRCEAVRIYGAQWGPTLRETPKGLVEIPILCQKHFVCKCLHCFINIVTSRIGVRKAPKYILVLGPKMR